MRQNPTCGGTPSSLLEVVVVTVAAPLELVVVVVVVVVVVGITVLLGDEVVSLVLYAHAHVVPAVRSRACLHGASSRRAARARPARCMLMLGGERT